MDKYLKYKKKYIRLIGGVLASTNPPEMQKLNLIVTNAQQYVFEYIDNDKKYIYIFDPFGNILQKYRERTISFINGKMCTIIKFVPQSQLDILDDDNDDNDDKCDKCDTLVVEGSQSPVLMVNDCNSIDDFMGKYEKMKLEKNDYGYFFVDNLTQKTYYLRDNDITESAYNDRYYRISTETYVSEVEPGEKVKLRNSYARIYCNDGKPDKIVPLIVPTTGK
jgi:hypothetical protein